MEIKDRELIYRRWLHTAQSGRDLWFMMLREYCNKSNGFNRDFASRYGRILVHDIEKLYGYIVHYCYELKRNCYISVYDFRDVVDRGDKKLPDYTKPAIIDKIVFDIDVEDLEYGWMLAKDLFDSIGTHVGTMEKNSAKFGIFFTGGRGFHVYYVPSPSKKMLSGKSAKEFCDDVYELMGEPEGIDTSLFGDVARDIRIPYTLHPQTGRQMIPVTTNMDIEQVIAESKILRVPKETLFKPYIRWKYDER